MKKYEIDYENSKFVYNQNKNILKIKECYYNIFNLINKYPNMFLTGIYKIVYCYVTINNYDNLYCRHCCILYKNKIIDPTIFCYSKNDNDIKNTKYLIFKIFDDIYEYHNCIEKDHFYPALIQSLNEEDKLLQEEALKNNMFLLP